MVLGVYTVDSCPQRPPRTTSAWAPTSRSAPISVRPTQAMTGPACSRHSHTVDSLSLGLYSQMSLSISLMVSISNNHSKSLLWRLVRLIKCGQSQCPDSPRVPPHLRHELSEIRHSVTASCSLSRTLGPASGPHNMMQWLRSTTAPQFNYVSMLEV